MYTHTHTHTQTHKRARCCARPRDANTRYAQFACVKFPVDLATDQNKHRNAAAIEELTMARLYLEQLKSELDKAEKGPAQCSQCNKLGATCYCSQCTEAFKRVFHLCTDCGPKHTDIAAFAHHTSSELIWLAMA